jgi:hypothetical protein
MLFGRNMTYRGWLVRMAICAAADLFDFTAGRTLFVVPGEEIVSSAFYTLMWGPIGLLNLAELADFTEQIDAFIPSALLVGAIVGWRKGFLGGAKRPEAALPPPLDSTRGSGQEP